MATDFGPMVFVSTCTMFYLRIGHEYTHSNLMFAAALEPDSTAVKVYIAIELDMVYMYYAHAGKAFIG